MKERGRAIRPFSFVDMKFALYALFFALVFTAVAPAFEPQPQTATQKTGATQKAAPHKSSGAAKTRPAAGKTGPASARTAAKTGVASKKRVSTVRKTAKYPSVSRQASPTSDRYKEIQQALAAKGYLKSEPTGVWDADSVAAMRQFQTDRNLDPSGKLTAAALIDLGLGPKPETTHAPVTGPGESVPEPPQVATAPAQQP